MVMTLPFDLNVTYVLPDVGATVEPENAWMLYVFAALVLGIVLGGTLRGLAKLVLAGVIFSGFVVIALIALQRHDLLSTIASVVFGVIILIFSFLVKVGKSYTYVKR